MKFPRAFILAGVLLAGCSPSAAAGGGPVASAVVDDFMGAWKYEGAIVAPWVGAEGYPERVSEITKTPLVLAEAAASGPSALSCTGATYQVRPLAFTEMFDGKVTDATVARTALGIRGEATPTLMVACTSAAGDAAFSYHLVQKNVLLLALNDIVYQFARQAAAPASAT